METTNTTSTAANAPAAIAGPQYQQTARGAAAEPVDDGPRYLPSVDVVETADEFRFLVDLPGVRPGDIDVTYDGGILTIDAKVATPPSAGQTPRQVIRQEFEGGGHFRRAFDVGREVEPERITAEHKNGELTLHVPKAAEFRVKRIAVRAEP